MQQQQPSRGVRVPPRPVTPAPAPTRTAGSTAPGAAPAPTRPFKRLTAAEQLDRRRKGLCFNCDEPYAPGHTCARLFYLETVDDVAADVVAAGLADAAISKADTAPG